jgi:hypothetical protein
MPRGVAFSTTVPGCRSPTPDRGSTPKPPKSPPSRNFPVYDTWDGLICAHPALIRLELPSKLSIFRAIYGMFEWKTSEDWTPGLFGGLGVDPQDVPNRLPDRDTRWSFAGTTFAEVG